MGRLLWWLLAVPVGLVGVALAVANRKPVTLVLDPFLPETPAFALDVPLHVVICVSLIIGIALGGTVVWLGQGRHRRAARHWRAAAERFRAASQAEGEGAAAARGLPPPPGGQRAA